MAAKPPTAERINARAAKDRAFLKRALKNPGLRSKLDPKYLAAPQRAQRQINLRLNAPITPGSSTTERDLAHAAQAATTVKYGPTEREYEKTLGEAQTTERDTGSFYDQYLQALQQHSQNVQAYQAGAQQALQQTQAGITGLAGQDFSALQQQANQGAAQQGVAPAGDLSQLASGAAATRQALIGSFQAQQALQGAAANQYAGAQANVVGPGQKLAAQAQARGKVRTAREDITKLKTLEGAYNQQFRDERRQDEFKNVLAQQTLGANIAGKAATAAANTPEAAAAKTSATVSAGEEAKNANKLGLSVHQYRLLGPTERKRRLDALKATKPGSSQDTIYTSGPFAGKSRSEIAAMSHAQRQGLIDDYRKTGGKGKGKDVLPSTQYERDFYRKYGVKPASTEALNSATDSISSAGRWINQVLQSNPKMPLAQVGQVVAAGQGKSKDSAAIPKHKALFVRVAMDIKQYGGITPATASRLHHAGYSVAKLRLKMGRKPKPYKPPSSGPASKVPGVGGS